MRVFTNELKVGLILVTTVIFFVILISAVGNFGKIWGAEKILVRMESAAGLKDYASVTFAGKKIGVVEKVEIREIDKRPWVVLTCSLDEAALIVLDSTACIKQSSLLGEAYLELSRGKSKISVKDAPQKPWMLEGAPVITFDQVFAAVDHISAQFEDILLDVKRISGDKNLQVGVKDTLKHLRWAADRIHQVAVGLSETIADATTDIRYILGKSRGLADNLDAAGIKVRDGAKQFPDLIGELRIRVQNLSKHLESLVAQVNDMVNDSKPKVNDTLERFSLMADQIGEDAGKLAEQLHELAANLNQVVTDNQGGIRRIVDDLTVTATHLSSIARQLDEHPWRAIWKTEGRLQPSTVTPEWNPEPPGSKKK